jgi:hypothetical protein
VAEVAKVVNRRPFVLSVPLQLAVAACRTYERTARRPLLRTEQLQRLDEDKVVDIGPAQRDLGFAPRSFAIGIHEEATRIR